MSENISTNADENKEKGTPILTRKIGGMTYRVGIHFSKTSKETMDDKVKRMIINDSKSICEQK